MDDYQERERDSFFHKAYENLVPEVLRKTVLLGLGGASMTEEGIRKLLGGVRLPREEARKLLEYITEQSQKSRQEVYGLVGTELKKFLRTLDLEKVVRDSLQGMKIKIQAEISFEADDSGSTTPRIELETRLKEPADATSEMEGSTPEDLEDA